MKIANKITWLKTEQITPYANNPRINDAAVEVLVKMIPEVGFNVPLVVDKNYVIVKGHARYKAAQRLGLKELPCIVVDGTAEQIAQDRILDNKLSELSKWDEDALRVELREINYNIPEIGFTIANKEIKPLNVDEKDIAKAQDRLIENREIRAEKKQLQEVICPECGTVFYVNLDEIKRYTKESKI